MAALMAVNGILDGTSAQRWQFTATVVIFGPINHCLCFEMNQSAVMYSVTILFLSLFFVSLHNFNCLFLENIQLFLFCFFCVKKASIILPNWSFGVFCVEKLMNFETYVPLIFNGWKNDQKMQLCLGMSGNHNFSFLSVEKYKKIFNVGFFSVESTHFMHFIFF